VVAEFPWMTYFVALFILVVVSIGLSLIGDSRIRYWPPPRREDLRPREGDSPHSASDSGSGNEHAR
jgi:hypothetical protein